MLVELKHNPKSREASPYAARVPIVTSKASFITADALLFFLPLSTSLILNLILSYLRNLLAILLITDLNSEQLSSLWLNIALDTMVLNAIVRFSG